MAWTVTSRRVTRHHPAWARNRHPGRVDHARVTLSARRAALLISVMTLCIGIAGGVVMWVVDREDFPTLGLRHVVRGPDDHDRRLRRPHALQHRRPLLAATFVMITGIGFMSVITATITAIFVESARRKRRRRKRSRSTTSRSGWTRSSG